MMFLHYILKQDKNSIISKVFWAQVRNPVKNDWAVLVQEDLVNLNINKTFEEIERVTKSAWKKQIKQVIKETAFEYLTNQIEEKNMKKIINLEYSEMKLQEYFNCQTSSRNIKQFIFKLRTRMIKVGDNFGTKEPCPICKEGNNDQRHILECNKIED